MERKRTDNEEFARICEEEAAVGHTVVVGKEADLMPCISLHQPWAQFIALGWKTIETRKHTRFASLIGRRIAIHASQRWDNGWGIASRWLSQHQCEQTIANRKHWPLGKVVASALVSDLRVMYVSDEPKALFYCEASRNAMPLSDIRMLEPAIPITGKQGIFYIPASLCK